MDEPPPAVLMLFKEYIENAVILQCILEITLFYLKKPATFVFPFIFSYLSTSFTEVINRTHHIGHSSCATAAQITTIITITTR